MSTKHNWYVGTLSAVILATAVLAACGASSTGSDASSADATGTDATGTDASGTGDSGAGTRGCATAGGPQCGPGTMCCVGVPYPEEGVCNTRCDLDSDRALKDEIVAIDGAQVLARLQSLPLYQWHYRRDSAGVRHLGPMAQDFHAAYGLGADARHIHPLDGQGVALAAVQALARRVDGLARENVALRAELARLRAGRARH